MSTNRSSDMSSALKRELDLWSDKNVSASFWWRDDDAQVDSDPFKRLVELSRQFQAPLIIAVSPGLLDEPFAATLNGVETAWIAAHGFRHINHSKSRQAAEFGDDRPLDVMCREIDLLTKYYSSMFPQRGLSMFVPPWHGLDLKLVPYLAQIGYAVLSTHEPMLIRAAQIAFGSAPCPATTFFKNGGTEPAAGIRRIDIAINALKYRRGQPITVNPLLIHHVLGALRLRRLGFIRASQPIGFLTHHLQHDETAWIQLCKLISAIAEHPASHFVRPSSLCPLLTR